MCVCVCVAHACLCIYPWFVWKMLKKETVKAREQCAFSSRPFVLKAEKAKCMHCMIIILWGEDLCGGDWKRDGFIRGSTVTYPCHHRVPSVHTHTHWRFTLANHSEDECMDKHTRKDTGMSARIIEASCLPLTCILDITDFLLTYHLPSLELSPAKPWWDTYTSAFVSLCNLFVGCTVTISP